MILYLLGTCPRCSGDLAQDIYDRELWTCIQCARTFGSNLVKLNSKDGLKTRRRLDTDYSRDRRRDNWIRKHTATIASINSGLTVKQVAEEFNLTLESLRLIIIHMKDLDIYNPGVVSHG